MNYLSASLAAKALLATCIIGGPASRWATAQGCKVKSGCPSYKQEQDQTPYAQNQSVQVQLSSGVNSQGSFTNLDPNSAEAQAANAGLAVVSQNASSNGSGDTFASQNTTPAGNVNNVEVVFNTTTTSPTVNGAAVAATSTYASNGNGTVTGYVTIYLAATNCPTAIGNVPCFNSNASGYAAAISGLIQHELYHGLGIGDTTTTDPNKPSVMNSYNGTNNAQAANPKVINNCDNTEVVRQSNIRKYGTPCPPK